MFLNSRRSRAVIALVGAFALAIAAFIGASSSTVLASWQDAVWGNSTFGKDANYVPPGYARSMSTQGNIVLTLTSDTIDGVSAFRNQDNPGTTETGWQNFSASGLLGFFAVSAQGDSCASYFSNSSDSCRPDAGPVDGSAASSMRNLAVKPSGLTGTAVATNGTFSTSVLCPVDGAPIAGPMTHGTLTVGERNINIPGPNSTTPFDFRDGVRTYQGALYHDQVTSATSATSRLRITLNYTVVLGFPWTLNMNILNADCGKGAAPAPLGGVAAPMAAFGAESLTEEPPTEDLPAEESRTQDALAEDDAQAQEGKPEEGDQSGESTAEESTAEAPTAGDSTTSTTPPEPAETQPEETQPEVSPAPAPPAGPVEVRQNQPFAILNDRGEQLATGTFAEVVRETPDRVAVRVKVSDVAGGMAPPKATDFRIDGGSARATVADLDGRKGFPDQLSAGQSYDAWVSMEVGAASSLLWRPEGTQGWSFTLPAPPAVKEQEKAPDPAVTGESVETGEPAVSSVPE